MSIFDGTAAQKLTDTPAVNFSYPCRCRWFIFTKQIIALFWVIIYSYFKRFFKIGVLRTLYTIHSKTTVSESLFNQPVAGYFFNKRLRNIHFLVDIAKLRRTLLRPPDSAFIEHVCNYNIIKFNVNLSKWLFQPFETLINILNIEMYECEIKITWISEIIIFLLFWFCKICY